MSPPFRYKPVQMYVLSGRTSGRPPEARDNASHRVNNLGNKTRRDIRAAPPCTGPGSELRYQAPGCANTKGRSALSGAYARKAAKMRQYPREPTRKWTHEFSLKSDTAKFWSNLSIQFWLNSDKSSSRCTRYTWQEPCFEWKYNFSQVLRFSKIIKQHNFSCCQLITRESPDWFCSHLILRVSPLSSCVLVTSGSPGIWLERLRNTKHNVR
jgi:hypothetical protein